MTIKSEPMIAKSTAIKGRDGRSGGRVAKAEMPKPLTARSVKHAKQEGQYLDGNGLYLVVGPGGTTKSWLFIYRFRKRRREMGLGSARDVPLAKARELREEARALIRRDTDPIDHRKEQRRTHWLSEHKNATFKQMADEWIVSKCKGPKDEVWRNSTKKAVTRIVNKYLKPIHDWSPAQIDENVLFKMILEPMMEATPSMMDHSRHYAEKVFDWCKARRVFPADRMNPASKKALAVLMGNFRHHATHLPPLHYDKMPELVAALRAIRQRQYFMPREAARAVGHHPDTIYAAIYDGRLKADKSLLPFPTSRRHWQIRPTDLFALWPQVVQIDPPPQTIASYVLELSILLGTRPSETRMMQKSEYDPVERLLIIPWQRHKEGRKTRQDHIIPLAPRAVEIIEELLQWQRRDEIESDFICGHFSHPITRARPGHPPSPETCRKLLRHILRQEFPKDLDKVWHAMRTAFRSWGEAQRRNGIRLYDDKTLERAINHIGGYGDTKTIRIYNRDTPFIHDMIPLFEHWAHYLGGNVVPFHKQVAKSSKRG